MGPLQPYLDHVLNPFAAYHKEKDTIKHSDNVLLPLMYQRKT